MGAKVTRKIMPTNPPIRDAVAEMPMALPDSPRRVIGYPSKPVTMAPGVPGMLTNMAVIEPEYTDPTYIPTRKIIAEYGFIPKVSGVKTAMPIVEVKPGIIPMTTPIIVPNNKNASIKGSVNSDKPAT